MVWQTLVRKYDVVGVCPLKLTKDNLVLGHMAPCPFFYSRLYCFCCCTLNMLSLYRVSYNYKFDVVKTINISKFDGNV